MKQFTINQDSTLPYLEIEPINDGRNDFKKLYYAIQAATVTFTMWDYETGIKKIVNAPCHIVPQESEGCRDSFKIQYRWNKRDTKIAGIYRGRFKITFPDDVEASDMNFPSGDLLVPIHDELVIVVK